YGYDSFGNRATMVDGVGTWAYACDDLNRLTGVLDPAGNDVTYAYDAAGNRTGLNVAGTALTNVTYSYDAAHRLDTVTDPFAGSGAVINYDYDAASRVVSVALPNGISTSYDYDSAGRLNALTNGLDGSL